MRKLARTLFFTSDILLLLLRSRESISPRHFLRKRKIISIQSKLFTARRIKRTEKNTPAIDVKSADVTSATDLITKSFSSASRLM